VGSRGAAGERKKMRWGMGMEVKRKEGMRGGRGERVSDNGG